MLKLILFLSLVLVVSCRTIYWTGGAGNSLWNFAGNWQGNSVPTADDDVFINAVGGAAVGISQPASALSVTIGGGTYPQSLQLLSQLSVGAGGVTVQVQGTLQVSSNNDLPLSSKGAINVQAGGILNFASGAISTSNVFVNSGAGLIFSTNALKLITGSNVTVNGYATIQPSTLQFAKGGAFYSNGNLTGVGQITVFSTDGLALFQAAGQFNYEGNVATLPLTFQVPTKLLTDFFITSGGVVFADSLNATGTINAPAGTTVTISGGPTMKTINAIKGAGSLVVQGNAIFLSTANLTSLTVTDSGTVTFNNNANFSSATVSGKVITAQSLTVATFVLAGGTLNGAGTLTTTASFRIEPSSGGNTNSFIGIHIFINSAGSISSTVYVLLQNGGNLHIVRGYSFAITAATTFAVQNGNPFITVDGTLSIQIPNAQQIYATVNIQGAGVLSVVSGTFLFQADTVRLGSINVGSGGLLNFQSAIISVGDVTGTGSLNVTAAPSPVSVFGKISAAYLGIPSGSIQATSFAVSTFEFWNGAFTLPPGAANSADTFHYYGGQLIGAAKLTSKSITVQGSTPQVLNQFVVTTSVLSLSCGSSCTLLTQNGAQLIAGLSMFQSHTNSNPVIHM